MEGLKEILKNFVEEYGYVALFLISFSESIIQPVPPDPFIAGGTLLGLDPLKAALIATFGSIFGGLTAHFLGKVLGEKFVRDLIGEKNFSKGEGLFKKYGVFALIVAGLTPIPFKAVCWLAGIFEMNRLAFLIGAFIGRFPRFMLVALLGDLPF